MQMESVPGSTDEEMVFSSDRPPTAVEVEGSSDCPPTVVEVGGSSDRPPTAVEVEGSSDCPPTAVEVGGSSDCPPTVVEVEGSSDRPPTVVEVEGGSDRPPPYTFSDLDSAPDPPLYNFTSPTAVEMEDNSGSPPPYQALINGSPPPNYINYARIDINGRNDRPPVYMLIDDQAPHSGNHGYGSAAAPVETRTFRCCRCLTVVLLLMCLSVLLMNPVAFMLTFGALVNVLQYNCKVCNDSVYVQCSTLVTGTGVENNISYMLFSNFEFTSYQVMPFCAQIGEAAVERWLVK